MRLQTKVTVAIFLTAIGAGLILFFISNYIFTRNYADLEENTMSLDLGRIINSIDDRIANLEMMATDWAEWDDMYTFVEDRNAEFIRANFAPSTFDYLGASLIVIENSSGEVVLAKGYDVENGKESPISAGLQQHLSDNSITGPPDLEGNSRGIIQLPEGALLFASHTILTSEGTGPPRGKLVMGRYLDNALIQQLSKTTRLPISINLFNDKLISDLANDGRISLSKENPILIKTKDTNTIAGYTLLLDARGNPCVVASLVMPRTIYAQGRVLIGSFNLGILLVSLLLILVNILFLNRSILFRLQNLGKSAIDIAQHGDFSARIALKGRDEISVLAEKMNEMLAKLAGAQASLKESENKYSTLVEKSNDGIIIIQDGLLRYANTKMAQITGIPIKEVIGKPFVNFISPEDLTITKEYYEARMAGNPTPETYEIGIIHQKGNVIPVEISAKVIEINGSSCDMVVVRDVSERKRIESSLRESEEKYRNLFENANDMIQSIDLSGKIIYANRSWMKTLGYDEADLLDLNIFQIVHPDSLAHCQEIFTKVIRGENMRHFEAVFVTKEGKKVFVEGNAIGRSLNGKIIATQGIFRDITQRKQEEQERQRLREKAEMSSRLAAVGEMAAGVAHEINNPLTSVLRFSQLLAERTDLSEDVKKELHIIADGSNRVKEIVRRLLTFARQTKPVRTRISLNELIEATLGLRAYVLQSENIKVIKHFDPELPWVVVDPSQLQQVFLNLIVNAEQAMLEAQGKGTLTIATEKRETNIRITFQDDGTGITKESRLHLFEPFFTTKAPGKGTGLGLSLSRSIVLEHGGEMSVESEPGQGATFIIDLPIREVPPAETTPPSLKAEVKPRPTKKGRVLVVDDEPGIRGLIEKVLTQAGHSVETTSGPAEAMDKLTKVKFDVLLADVRMPGMSGMELYSLILAKTPAMVGKIIFITGDVMGEDIKTFLADNNLPYLPKPFDIEALKEKVGKMVSRLISGGGEV